MNKMISKLIKLPLLLLLIYNSSFAQNSIPESLEEKMQYCNTNFSDILVSEIKKDFQALELHFIKKGLLIDNSGSSYYNVYEKIAEKGTFDFQTNYSLRKIDSINKSTFKACFYKLLTADQLNNLTDRQVDVMSNLAIGFQGNVNLSEVGKRFVNLFVPDDFQLEYFQYMSLYSFYLMSQPTSNLFSIIPDHGVTIETLETVVISLDENDEISAFGKKVTIEEARELVAELCISDSISVIEMYSSRSASYESYINLLKAINEPINEYRNRKSKEKFGIEYSELAVEQREEISNIKVILKEPK